jgi:hypothetical protein
MARRYTYEYDILDALHDGYVNHTTSYFENDTTWSGLYWNFYDDDGYCDWFKAIANISIPQGSKIIAATLNLSVYYVDPAGWVETEIHAAVGNDIPTDYSSFDSMIASENYVNVHLDPLTSQQIVQYDVKNIIQEKIDDLSWVEGNNIIFFSMNTNGETSDSGVDWDTFEYNPYTQLIVVFEPPEVTTIEQVLSGSRVETFKYERLTLQDGKYKHYDYLDDEIEIGIINSDFTKEIIGSANFQMLNNENINYLSDLIRPWYVVSYDGNDYEFPLGTYMLISPEKNSDGMVITRNIQGYDLLYALVQDKTTTSSFFEKGDNVTDAIKDILDNIGTWVNYSIPDSDEVLVEDMSYEIGKSKLFIINSLLNTINYYPLWATGNGFYKSMKWSDSNNSIWTFEDNENSLYQSGIKLNLDYSQMYNKVVVVANQLTTDTEPLVSSLTFEDEGLEDHPLSYTSLGRYIVKKFDSEAVSQDYVDARARRELLKMLEIEEAIEYKHAFVSGRFTDGLPYQGDCFKFKNTLLDIDEIYKIESQSFNIKVGSMVNSVIRRVTSV